MVDRLTEEIEERIRQHCSDPVHRDAALVVLTRPGYALHPESGRRAGVVALEVYRTILGKLDENAWPAAAAVELYMEAGFLFDDVADQEVDPDLASTCSEELALAITLMNCGVAAACDAARGGEPGAAGLLAVEQMVRDCITACAGQYRDAHLSRQDSATTEEALKMTELKAGGCGRLAASFAAAIATDDPQIIQLFGDFGFNLFTYLQLIDDIRDAIPKGSPRDLLQQKKTVPLVFFGSSPSPDRRPTRSGTMHSEFAGESGYEFRVSLHETGAKVFSAVVAEAYLNRAKTKLAEISKRLGSVETLEQLVRSLQISPQEVLVAR